MPAEIWGGLRGQPVGDLLRVRFESVVHPPRQRAFAWQPELRRRRFGPRIRAASCTEAMTTRPVLVCRHEWPPAPLADLLPSHHWHWHWLFRCFAARKRAKRPMIKTVCRISMRLDAPPRLIE